MTLDVLSWIVGVVGLLGIIFTVYKYFRDPQIATDKRDAVMETRFNARFTALEVGLAKILENHLPHMDAKIDAIQMQLAESDKSIVRLTTIIEERIPRK